MQSDRPYYVCQKQGCARNTDCLGKQVCATDGQCHDQCLTQKDCLADQVCTAGACADTTEIVNGSLPNLQGDAGGVGQRCTLPTDCPGDLVCLRGGVCGAECVGEKDCPKTYTCQPLRAGGPGRCFPPASTDGGLVDASMQDATIDAATTDADAGAAPQPFPVAVNVGVNFTCVIFDSGKVKCWGMNSVGRLGLGDTQDRGGSLGSMGDALPYLDLGPGRTAKELSLGVLHACAILDDNTVKCWGDNAAGQLGLGDTVARGDNGGEMGSALPTVSLGTGRTAKHVACGESYTCAILDDDQLKCWGSGTTGRLGLGDTAARGNSAGSMGDALPYVSLGAGRTVKAIAPSISGHTCALLDNNGLKCWGDPGAGATGATNLTIKGDGPGEMGDALPYVSLGAGRTVLSVVTGGNRTCALLDNNLVKCFGLNGIGELGVGDTMSRGFNVGDMGDALPYASLGTGRTVKQVSTFGQITCAILDTNGLKCWGANNDGNLGLGNITTYGGTPGTIGDALPFVNLGTGRTPKVVSASYAQVCAILDNNGLKCWGTNDGGQLGLGDTTSRGGAANQMGDNLPYVKLTGP